VKGEVEQVVVFLAGRRQALEILGSEYYVAGRAGHRSLAAALERLAVGLRECEQVGTFGRLDLALQRAVGVEETDGAHVQRSCDRAASAMVRQAEASSVSPV